MKVVFTEDQLLHDVEDGAWMGEPEPYYERPERVTEIVGALKASGFENFEQPTDFGLEPLRRVHSDAYLDFLRTLWPQSRDAGEKRDALFPSCYAPHGMAIREPVSIDGQLGYFSFDTSAPITADSWAAASASANTVLSAQQIVASGARAAFALCRPPGHHAGREYCGGFCYLNNVAIAAEAALAGGASKVAILDVDYHHGNGTQDIFYERDDVLFVSIHAHPDSEFPYLMGYPDETGRGNGKGCNLNFAIRKETASANVWLEALDSALASIREYAPDTVLVSLGVDAFHKDPFGGLGLIDEDFRQVGVRVAALGLPTLFVMEGGYAMQDIGDCVASTLLGFKEG